MDKIEQYIETLLPTQAEWVKCLQSYAKEHHVPIIDQISIEFLLQLLNIHKPASILELGTAIGYSALRMHQVLPEAKITTIERNEEMYELAMTNIAQYSRADNIELIHGDAFEAIDQLIKEDRTYQFIFIDAAKAQYKRFFECIQPLVDQNAIIICDNILFRGYVANPELIENKRLKSLASKIATFNEWLMNHPNYVTTIIPIGDGISISIKNS